jgi:uncharacterized protein (DUF1810 family)
VSLERFVDAQDRVWTQVLEELRAGDKRSHWMWFVFPQLAGLGRSPMAVEFALTGVDEARDYLAHPVLGARLHECAQLLLGLGLSDPVEVLGFTDALKLKSSMTLFAQVDPMFREVLDRFYAGEQDAATLALLSPPA